MTTISPRHRFAAFLRRYLATSYVGEYGYDDTPYYARLGTTGNLYPDRVHAPVRTEVRYANNHRQVDNCIHPCGDVLRWLDDAPRGVTVVVPDYSWSHLQGEWRYYKDRYGQWQVLGNFQFDEEECA